MPNERVITETIIGSCELNNASKVNLLVKVSIFDGERYERVQYGLEKVSSSGGVLTHYFSNLGSAYRCFQYEVAKYLNNNIPELKGYKCL